MNEQQSPAVIDKVLELVQRDWRRLVAIPLVTAVIASVFALVVPERFTVHAAFLGDTGAQSSLRLSSGLAAIASQMGISGSLGQVAPDFYGDLVKSRTILEPVALRTYRADPRMRKRPPAGNLVDLYKADGDSPEERFERFLDAFDDDLNVSVDQVTGVVSIDLKTKWPSLGKAILDSVLFEVDHYNQRVRRSAAHSERQFVEQRLGIAQGELNDAENALTVFYQQNRSWQGSPALTVVESRLRRRLDLRQEVYRTLASQLEEAAINEVRDTPVLTVVSAPFVPVVRTFPHRTVLVLACTMLAFFATAAWLVVRDQWRTLTLRDPQLAQRYEATVSSLRSPFRRRRKAMADLNTQ